MILSNEAIVEVNFIVEPKVLSGAIAIAEKLGEINAAHLYHPSKRLRKRKHLNAVLATLAIEGNYISIDQLIALSNKYIIRASEHDSREAINALQAYAIASDFNYLSLRDFKKLHKTFSKGLDQSTSYRSEESDLIKKEMEALFSYLNKHNDHLLIKSCLFHIQLLKISPYEKANIRLALFWQKLILKAFAPVFDFITFENRIYEKQREYRKLLTAAIETKDPVPFILFLFDLLDVSLEEYLRKQKTTLNNDDRMAIFIDAFEGKSFTRQDYLRRFKNISSVTASRDLRAAVENNIILKMGDKRLSKYKLAIKVKG